MSQAITITEEAKVAEKQQTKIDITEHLLSLDDLQKKAEVEFDSKKPSSSKGLSEAEVAIRQEKYGKNMLSPPKRVHPILQFLSYFLQLFNVMLWVSGIVAYIIYAVDPAENFSNVYIGGILIGVCILNAYIEFYQTQKSQAILESFLNLIPAKCNAVRNGAIISIPAVDLVYGDIVYIRSGDKIPADLCLFQATELKVDNSSLTGEAEAQERLVNTIHKNPLESSNICFNGTLAVNGEGYGVVIRTGDNTVIGQIAFLASSEERRNSPMSEEIERFVKIIAGVAAVVTLIFFLVSKIAKNFSWAVSFNFAIGTFTGFVPQGLPATVTVLLSLAAKRMANRNVLVKDLQGVETLGAITLLATDKTGTLTRNQMTVTFIWSGDTLYYALLQGKMEKDAIPLDSSKPAPNEILHMSLLCSRARFENVEGPITTRPILGDATEAGLLRNAALKLDGYDTVVERFPKVFEIPFNSDNKWAMTIHKKKHSNGSLMLYLKGAPERVLRLCTTFHDGTSAVPLTDEHKKKFNDMYNFLAGKGHRVLAFAALPLPESEFPADFEFVKQPPNYPTHTLTFMGLVSLEDPPKHGVREAIGHCREAGIKVMMVTGDHPLTAEAIGRKINLMIQDTKEQLAVKRKVEISQIPESDVSAIVIHGERIDELTEEEWANIFSKEEIVFARTSPKHKLTIVKRAQALGHIVGVTGDGVNDSPALKKADLGIAMNVSGSDVSKEAAAMILIDDNFASAVNGIEEGRLIFQNLKKSIRYTISHTMPQVYANLLYISVPIPLPLSAILILVTDLGFELFLALSFAWEISENRAGLMKLPPRKPVSEESIERKKLMSIPNTSFLTRISNNWKYPAEEETLVDGEVLSWAYLEAGTLETIGCLTCYFLAMFLAFKITPADCVKFASQWGTLAGGSITLANGDILDTQAQKDALAHGQSAFYLALMIQQCFNLFACKARLGLPIGKFMIANHNNFYGVILGALVTFSIVYIPPFNVAFGTSFRTSPYVWITAFGFGVALFTYSIIRFLVKQYLNPVKFSKDIIGLDLHPTRFSTGRH